MTAGEIITAVDALEPNAFSLSQKLSMLNGLEGRIFTEIILSHRHSSRVSFTPVDASACELIIPSPFAENIYGYYLQAMMALENSETARYNQQITMFNDAFRAWSSLYNRTAAPAGAKENRLKF